MGAPWGGWRWLAAVLVSALVAAELPVGTGAPPARAGYPGPEGLIAFAEPREPGACNETTDIKVVMPDGSGLRTLIPSAGDPNWSPDGRSIAYSTGSWVVVADADGANARDVGFGRAPSWSPDGTQIVAESGFDLWIYSLSGGAARRLTDTGLTTKIEEGTREDGTPYTVVATSDWTPAWSPAGDEIVFGRNVLSGSYQHFDLWKIRPDGTGAVAITGNYKVADLPDTGIDDLPEWSPDGSQIAWRNGRSYPDGNQVYLMPAGGGQGTNVSNAPYPQNDDVPHPTWSPQGRLAWAQRVAGPEFGREPDAIFVEGGDTILEVANGICAIDWGSAIAGATADFVAHRFGPGQYQFESTSEDPDGLALDHRWDFGDGTSGFGSVAAHTYSLPGTYSVRLTVTNEQGEQASVSKQVIVEAPELILGIDYVDRDHSPLQIGEEVVARLTVSAGTEGVGDLSGVRFVGEPLVIEPVGVLQLLGGPTPAIPDGMTLAPGARATFDYRLAARRVGGFGLSSTVIGTDAAGGPVPAVEADLSGQVPGLKVDVVIDPAEFTLNEREGRDRNKLSVRVDVTNVSTQIIDDVTVQGDDRPITMRTLRAEPGVALTLLEPVPSGDLGSLEPGDGTQVTYTLEAFSAAYAELSVFLEGAAEGISTGAVGKGVVKVLTDVLIEVDLRVEDRPKWLSGQTVRLQGTIRNVSDEQTVGVISFPITEGNAGNGHLFPSATTQTTPDGPQGFVLGPGESVEVSALLPTMRAIVATDAKVRYNVRAWIHEEDGSKTLVDETQVKFVGKGSTADPLAVPLVIDPPPPDDPLRECGLSYFECGVVVGLENFAVGTYDFARFLGQSVLDYGNYEWRLLAQSWQMWGEASLALRGDEQARQRLVDEIVADLDSLADAGPLIDKRAGALRQAVDAALTTSLDKWIGIYETGDLAALQFELGRLTGENPDLALEPLVASVAAVKMFARVGRTGTVTRQAMEKAAAAHQASLASRLAQGERNATPIEEVVSAGDQLSASLVRRGWGVDAEDLTKLQAIAHNENVLIAFRSRSEEALELIRSGLAREKPELMKIKTVNQLDIDYLGYRPERRARVELVEPPVDWRLTGRDLERALDSYMVELTGKHPELATDATLAKRVREQLKTRTEEYPVYSELFAKWQSQGIEVGFNYEKQGLREDLAKGVNDKRAVSVVEVTDDVPDPSRRYFEIKMSDSDGGGFKWVAGDTDFMAILNPDGTFILDDAKRRRIYEQLQKLVGMQHGETFAFTGEARAEYLRCCVQGKKAMVVVHPDGDLRAGHFVENRSILLDTPNGGKRLADPSGDFIMIAGAKYELKSQVGLFERIVLRSLSEYLREFQLRRLFFLPGSLYRFVDGLEPQQTSPTFDRTRGSVLQPDGAGGLQQWTASDGWQAIALSDALAMGGGKLLLLPQASLPDGAPAGATQAEVTGPVELGLNPDTPWFTPGDQVVIDPGGPNEERSSVAALGSLVFAAPLRLSHQPGEMVTLATPDPPAGGVQVLALLALALLALALLAVTVRLRWAQSWVKRIRRLDRRSADRQP